jgi:prepilin-type N-terminal cleavage/methylation domain-containing protein
MKRKSLKSAFTLVELMVVVVLIGLLTWIWSQLNINTIWDSNKLTIFNNKIITNFETIRNNTLLGKWTDSNVGVPDSWRISYNSSWNWTVTTNYLNWTWLPYTLSTITAPEFHSISQINCLDIWGTIINSNIANGSVIINWNNFSLSGGCSSNSRILEITTWFKNDTNKIHINALNWLIEVQ